MKEQNTNGQSQGTGLTLKPSELTDEHALNGAKGRFGYAISTYDDGYGQLYIHRDSMGISGIVRARTWEDAYGICEDEFFPEATETLEELVKEYGFRREHKKVVFVDGVKRHATDADYVDGKLPNGIFVGWETIETPDPEAWIDNELFQEAFGFRPNGPNKHDKLNHGIYAKDLNGDRLDLLTDKLAEELGITLEIELLS